MTEDEAQQYVVTMIDRAMPEISKKMVKAIGRMPAPDRMRSTAVSVFLLGLAERLIHTEAKAFSGEDADDAARSRRAISAIEQIRICSLERYGVGS